MIVDGVSDVQGTLCVAGVNAVMGTVTLAGVNAVIGTVTLAGVNDVIGTVTLAGVIHRSSCWLTWAKLSNLRYQRGLSGSER